MKKRKATAMHPAQPLEKDEKGVIRFKRNAIVCYLLDNGGIDLNQIARMDFTNEDREQFAQLIGYSHSGAGDLGYVSDETWIAAELVFKNGITETEARNKFLRDRLQAVASSIKPAVAELFTIHLDDLNYRG